MTEISRQIRNIRREKGITQDMMASKIHVTRQTISGWETGRTHPDVDQLPEIAASLGITVEELLGEDAAGTSYQVSVKSRVCIIAVCGVMLVMLAFVHGHSYPLLIHAAVKLHREWILAGYLLTACPLAGFLAGIILYELLSIFLIIATSARMERTAWIISAVMLAASAAQLVLLIFGITVPGGYWISTAMMVMAGYLMAMNLSADKVRMKGAAAALALRDRSEPGPRLVPMKKKIHWLNVVNPWTYLFFACIAGSLVKIFAFDLISNKPVSGVYESLMVAALSCSLFVRCNTYNEFFNPDHPRPEQESTEEQSSRQ